MKYPVNFVLNVFPINFIVAYTTVLRSQGRMTKIWLRYQEKIGYDKMYPSIIGFESDMEDKSLIK